MKAFGLLIAGSLLAFLSVDTSNAQVAPRYLNDAVKVTWVTPEKYRDVASANSNKRKYKQRVMDDLEKYIHKEIPRYLTQDETIDVNVYDLDLAGDIRPMMERGNDMRIVKSIYPPMVDIEYAIKDKNGQVVRQERKRFRDIAFNMSAPASGTKSLGYEKAMLKKWMRNELKQ